ncbi:hypothetical protein BaRGS_00006085 [Batillaria attramentaria]|uniref:Uncharacterized protein n=1 Tax=Batillaria attramentaria TaxID=370345 RepID=A0ABD0LT89_9CAEN
MRVQLKKASKGKGMREKGRENTINKQNKEKEECRKEETIRETLSSVVGPGKTFDVPKECLLKRMGNGRCLQRRGKQAHTVNGVSLQRTSKQYCMLLSPFDQQRRNEHDYMMADKE